MWAKYAGDHAGICLEFANTGGFFKLAREVYYGDSVELNISNPDFGDGYWFFWKKPEWSSEEEIRITLPRHSDGLVQIKPDWLTRIILGSKMTPADEEQIRQWSSQRSPHLKVVRARYDRLQQRLLTA